jgi:galactokinase
VGYALADRVSLLSQGARKLSRSNEELTKQYAGRFGSQPTWLASAAGRVNLLGEHTDYNDGFVLPMAIDRRLRIALGPRDDRRVVLASLDFTGIVELDLDALAPNPGGWDDYPRGVLDAIEREGYRLSGWQGLLAGDVPIGAGLSSSAALGVAVARAALAEDSAPWDGPRIARIVQQAENRWVGVQCGIMDQLVSACGVEGHALAIDCRSLEMQAVELPASIRVVVLDTSTRRRLGVGYNDRRRECEAAASVLGLESLRDLPIDELPAAATKLDSVALRRVRHVVTENARTQSGVAALRAGDVDGFGALVDASHKSLQDDFEVSTPELDAIVATARALPGCRGARMTGAGFGGCALAIVDAGAVPSFVADLPPRYRAITGLEPTLLVCQPSHGTALTRL